jgi:Mrp family chromosome partitioning ATPase
MRGKSSDRAPSSKEERDPPPAQVITEYRTVMEMLALLQRREMDLRLKFKSGNLLLSNNQQQLSTYDRQRRDLVSKYPGLAAQADAMEKNTADNPKWNLIMEKARLASARAKIGMLESHLQEIAEQFGRQYAIGAQIEEMDRRKQMEDAEYRSLEANLKNAKVDQALDPSRMPNITMVQQPTEPVRTYDRKVQKIILGLAGGGMVLGVALAFMIELLFDRRIKRPIEIQTRLQLPLLLSIPYIRAKNRGGLMLSHESGAPRIGGGGNPDLPAVIDPNVSVSAVRKANHFILPYSEAIRDRIIFNFEINNLTHKPKLVAVTGLSEAAGASTIAAGLAKSFSEIAGAKVLLVDLSSYHSEDSPLLGEVPQHSLNGALQLASDTKFKESAQRLYYASAMARRNDSGLTTFTPLHLYELMPELQASEFDYIIFDMPPIDQTSRTLTMAGLMDKVILVLDAENTSRDSLKWGYSELVKGRADVSCVFNKTRSHAPDWVIGGT